MNRTKRKWLAAILTAAMSLTMVPAAFAAEDISDSIATTSTTYNAMAEETNDVQATVASAPVAENAVEAAASDAVMDENTFRQAVANGGTVNLTGNVTLTGNTLNIEKAVTIDGADTYSITYTGTAQNAFQITTDEQVTFQNVTINATASGKRAICLYADTPHFAFVNGVINADERAIWMKSGVDVQPGIGAVITISNSEILNSRIPDDKTYDNWTTAGSAYRGVALWNLRDADVSVINTDILGFSYAFYLGGDAKSVNLNGNVRTVRDYENTLVTLGNCELKGWAAVYSWAARATITIGDTEMLGINNVASGGANSFATIVIDDGIYGAAPASSSVQDDPFETTFNIYGGSIKNYSTSESLAANNAQRLISLDRPGITKFNFGPGSMGENVVIKDQVGCANGVFYNDYMTYNDMVDFLSNKISGTNFCTLYAHNPDVTMNWGIVNELVPAQ